MYYSKVYALQIPKELAGAFMSFMQYLNMVIYSYFTAHYIKFLLMKVEKVWIIPPRQSRR